MAILPTFSFNYNVVKQQQTQNNNTTTTSTDIGRSFLFDFIEKKFVITDGRLTESNKRESLEQWIALCLMTYKDKYSIYKDTNFYCNIEDLLGKKLTSFTYAEFKREITESLLKNNNIKSIRNIELTQDKDIVTVTIQLQLIDNTLLDYTTRL